MRLVRAGLFLVAVTGSLAHADDGPAAPAPEEGHARPAPAHTKVPLRVVRVLDDTHQALLFDKTRKTHVLVDIGGRVDGYLVVDIDGDEVTLSGETGEVVLAAPDASWRRPRSVRDPGDAPTPASPARPEPAKPDPAAQPEDPYAEPAPGTGVAAHVAPAPAPAPGPGSRAKPGTPDIGTELAAPAPPPSAPTPPPPADPDAPARLGRAELGAALSDFGKLSASIRATFTPSGVRVDALGEGSLFARAGLKVGDVIAAVDNQPLHTLDDAATLYARAATARNVSIQVVRGGKPLTLRVAIQ